MRLALRELLDSADDPVGTESPGGFDYRAELDRALAVVGPLEAIAQRACVIDRNVQDASFFTELSFENLHGNRRTTSLAVRFSAFGRFFTTWSVCEPHETFAREIVERVIAQVERAGFVYVDSAELAEPYDGANPYIEGTWWTRFFDYV